MRVLWLLSWACLGATIAAHDVERRAADSGSKRVVCYYTNWSVYRPGTAKFNPQNINPYLCTHLIYAFGGLTRENGLRPYDKYQDIEQGGYAKFTGLKTYNKQLKTMLAIGGWNEGSTRFSPLVASEERRTEFVKNVVKFLRQNHFDGLDLDWEYPAFRDGGKPRDRDNYALLVQELREEFDRESSKTGRPRLLLTMAVPAGIEYIDKGYDIPKLNRYLDFMNILSYDYHSSFEPSVNHHSPLYPLEEEGEYNFDAQLSIDYTINHYLKLGADRDKLVLGIPTYGRSYTLFNPLSTEIGAPADGPGEQGDATREKGYLAYYEICENLQSDEWKVVKPNPKAMGPYAYKGNQWVGYDDEDIVRKKAKYVNEKGLGGIMYWAIDNDDFRGKCHGRPYPLIEAGKEAMLATGASKDVETTASRTKPRPRPRVTTEEPRVVNSGGGGSRPTTGKRRRPSTKPKAQDKRTSTTSTTTSTTPAYSYPTATPEPPTTPDPGSDFKCEDEGFFPHPRDCKKYFWCLDSGPSNLGIVAHQFTCPSGLFFNKAADSCDYARNVPCNTKAKAEVSTTTTSKPLTTTSKTLRITTSTTTTTTKAPVEEEEEEEEYEDYDEEPEEDPKSIKELIDLIKKLGGIENLEKQLHLDGSDEKETTNSATPPAISKKLYDRVLNSRGNTNANFFKPTASTKSSTPHTLIYKNRGRQNEGLDGLAEVAAVRQERPQYVTIRRERPTTPTPDREAEEDEEDEEEEVVKKEEEVKTSGREYVTIRRERPSKPSEPEVTTSKYVTLRRSKTTPTPVVEEEANDVPAVLEEVTSESVAVVKEEPVTRKKLSPFLPRTAKVGSVLESFRRKKKEEDEAVTTTEQQEKDDIVTVTTEAPKAKVSEAGQRTRLTTLQYLEVSRGRGNKLSTTQSSLEDDSNVNISSASTTSAPLGATRKRIHRPSSPSPVEELVSAPFETVPPSTTLEPEPFTTLEPEVATTLVPEASSTTLVPEASSTTSEAPPLSTTTHFTPTVTRVVTSERESGTTERQRITKSKYKGFYLTLAPSSSTVSPNMTERVEKIMEVNRITHVTFKDDFSIPFTRPISTTLTTASGESVSSTEYPEIYSTNQEGSLNQDTNDVSKDTTSTPQVTVSSSSLPVNSRKPFRQPFRGTSTRSPLTLSQRRRTSTAAYSSTSTESVDVESSSRKPFIPSRRGSYRPTLNTYSDDDVRSSTASDEEFAQGFTRRPGSRFSQTTTTVRPIPQYVRNRGRKKIVVDQDLVHEDERVNFELPRTSGRRVVNDPRSQVTFDGDTVPVPTFTRSRRPTTRTEPQSTTERPSRSRPPYVNRGRKKLVTPIPEDYVSPGVEATSSEQPLDHSSRAGRVVKKLRRRPVNGTTTTSDPSTDSSYTLLTSTTLDQSSVFTSSTVEDGTKPIDNTTPLPLTESYEPTLTTIDGLTDVNTVYQEEVTTPPVYNGDFDSAYESDLRRLVNLEVIPNDEVLQTEEDSSSVEVHGSRGTHKFSLDDVLQIDENDTLEDFGIKANSPLRRRPQALRPKTRYQPQIPQDNNPSYDEYQNTVVESRDDADDSRVPESKRRRVIKRKRLPDPSEDDVEEAEAVSDGEAPTTSRTILRRPSGTFYANSRLRSRTTTTTTSSTTEAPSRAASLRPGRRPLTPASRLNVTRRRKFGDTSTSASTSSTSEVTEAAITTLTAEESEVITEPARKLVFLRRRNKVSNSKANQDNSKEAGVNSSKEDTVVTVKAALNHIVDSQNEPSIVAGITSAQSIETITTLPDLANDAVVAIHHLSTIPTRPAPRELIHSTRFVVPAVTSQRPPRISTVAGPFFPNRGTAVYVTPSPDPQPLRSNVRGRPFSKITAAQVDPLLSSVEDYEYYDHGEGIFGASPAAGKVKIHGDGYIECLDQGNFPHPFSCKKFISCAKMENTDVLGWEYTCPRHLSFDPIGGICNWSAGLGCKE